MLAKLLRKLRAAFDMEQIINHLPGHIYWQDREGRYLGTNYEAARHIGNKTAAPIIGKTAEEALGKTNAAIVQANNQLVLEQGKEITVEERVVNENGEESVYYSTKRPLYDKKGRISGLVGVSIDITERKKMEEDLRIAKEKAEAANQAKREFLENISHDIKTPFNGILAYTDYLIHVIPEAEHQTLLKDIKASAEQALSMMSQVLSVAASDHAEIPIQLEQVSLNKVFHLLQKMARADIERKHLNLQISLSPALPETVLLDKSRITRILLNLLSNAIKFTPAHGKITLNAEMQKIQGENWLSLKVQDNGIGIPTDKLQTIFERFSRVSRSDEKYPGLGLGLHITQQFAKDMGGNITVESIPEKGTIFECRLPLLNTP